MLQSFPYSMAAPSFLAVRDGVRKLPKKVARPEETLLYSVEHSLLLFLEQLTNMGYSHRSSRFGDPYTSQVDAMDLVHFLDGFSLVDLGGRSYSKQDLYIRDEQDTGKKHSHQGQAVVKRQPRLLIFIGNEIY